MQPHIGVSTNGDISAPQNYMKDIVKAVNPPLKRSKR